MMKNIIKTRKVLLIFFTFQFSLLVFLTGCGYKPSTYYAKQEIEGKVYIELIVDLEDPKNSVLVKDALTEIVVGKFDRRLVYKKSLADTIMIVELDSVSTSALQKDEDGYVDLYRTNVSLSVKYKGPNKEGNISTSGSYDFTIDDGVTVSDVKRYEAIKTAANKAMEEVISKFAIESFRVDEEAEEDK